MGKIVPAYIMIIPTGDVVCISSSKRLTLNSFPWLCFYKATILPKKRFNASCCPGDYCHFTANQKQSHFKCCLTLLMWANRREAAHNPAISGRAFAFVETRRMRACSASVILTRLLCLEARAPRNSGHRGTTSLLLLSFDWHLHKMPVSRAFSIRLMVIVCKVQCLCTAVRLER